MTYIISYSHRRLIYTYYTVNFYSIGICDYGNNIVYTYKLYNLRFLLVNS